MGGKRRGDESPARSEAKHVRPLCKARAIQAIGNEPGHHSPPACNRLSRQRRRLLRRSSNVDVNWESPHLSRFLRGLAAHTRLIVTDRRGWGCSERFTPGHVPDVDTLTDDILAVMKGAHSERASIMATYESAIVAALFAATALAPKAQSTVFPWREPKNLLDKTIGQVRDFLRSHQPVMAGR